MAASLLNSVSVTKLTPSSEANETAATIQIPDRQPYSLLIHGMAKPDTKTASCTPDCFTPVMMPRKLGSMPLAIALFAAGLPKP